MYVNISVCVCIYICICVCVCVCTHVIWYGRSKKTRGYLLGREREGETEWLDKTADSDSIGAGGWPLSDPG